MLGVRFVAAILLFMVVNYAGYGQHTGVDIKPSLYAHDSTQAVTSSAVLSQAGNLLDSLMDPVDPLSLFPQLSSMGSVTVPKGYLFLLVGLLAAGGIVIFVADMVYGPRRIPTQNAKFRKRDKAERVVQDLKMQAVFEAFVVTLFDPLYFSHARPRAERVLAGKISEGETGADLKFDFAHKGKQAKFAIKCQYFKHVILSGERQLFSPTQYKMFRDFEEAHGLPLYVVLGFGGTPDDPKELFLVPSHALKKGLVNRRALSPYSKSGMFFYNTAAEKLQ